MSKNTLGLGTAAIGRPHYINIRQESSKDGFNLDTFKKHGFKVLDAAYDAGIRYFDTAPGYGIAEEMLIEWLSSKNDQEIELATKWGYTYVANFDIKADQHEVKEHSIDKLKEQWQQSEKLFPHLTTYQIHSATLETGVLENKEVLEYLAHLKAVHHLQIGVTTTGANQLEVLRRARQVEIDSAHLFDVFQVTYNILDQSLKNELIDLTKSGKRVIIKESLANGRLFPNASYSQYQTLYELLNRLSDRYQVGIDAIAMRYIIDSIAPFSVLSGASMTEHITQNIQINGFELNQEELTLLDDFAIKPDEYWAERKSLAWN